MSFPELVLLAFALAMDAVSVSAVLGTLHKGVRPVFRIAFHFGLFQALFPLLSATLGGIVLMYVDAWDHWVVFLVLLFLGGRTLYNAFRSEDKEAKGNDYTRGFSMIGLSVAVSIDAMGAGLALPGSGISMYISIPLIGAVTMVLSALAMIFAGFVKRYAGRKLDIVAGTILIILAFTLAF